MKVKIAGSGDDERRSKQSLITYLINDDLAVDAGCLGCISPLSAQSSIRHVLLTHAHADHTASLPVFLDNVHRRDRECVTVHGIAHTLETLRRHVFNDSVWPNVERLSIDDRPFVRFEEVHPGRSCNIGGYRILPVELNHAIPTVGYIIQETDKQNEKRSAVAIVSDTGPTDMIWKRLKNVDRLKMVLLELSFPDELAELAQVTGHLTPASFAEELLKIPSGPRVLAVHLKPAHRDRIVRQLRRLKLSRVSVGQPGKWYR